MEPELNIEHTVIEPKKIKCDQCHERDAFCMVICKQPIGELPVRSITWNSEKIEGVFFVHCCKECCETLPYETISVTTTLSTGYIVHSYPVLERMPILDEESSPILERYGKEMIRKGTSIHGGFTIGDVVNGESQE